jgi:photosystem II stability/assembly factor-like uncharacterized protein
MVKSLCRTLLVVECIMGLTTVTRANPTLPPGVWVDISPSVISYINYNHYFSQGMAYDPNNSSTIYLCVAAVDEQGWGALDGGIYKTTDGGSDWFKIGHLDKPAWDGTDSIISPVRIRVDPKNPNHLYCADGVRGSTSGFWVSTDAGITWTMPAAFTAAANDSRVMCSDAYSVAVDPTDFNHLLVSFHNAWANSGTCGFFESTDGGASFRIIMPDSRMTGPGFDIFFLYYPAAGIGDKNTWLVGCQGSGFFRTTDAGVTWSQVSTNVMTHGGSGIYYTKSGILYVGVGGAVLRSTNNGQTMQAVAGLTASYIGITGDGTNVYTGAFNTPSNMMIAPEATGTPWTPSNTQVIQSGPFEMTYDSTNRIVYASNPGWGPVGVIAMRVSDPNTGITLTNEISTPASIMDNATTPVTLSVNAAATGTIASVTIDLRPLGGSAGVTMTKTTGTTYTTGFSVQSGATPGNKVLMVTATDNSNHVFYGSITVTVVDHTAPVLVSQGKNAVASSIQDASSPASNAIDGNAGTRWSSAFSDPQWIYIDLGSSMTVNEVVLTWQAAYATAFQIQVSTDATNWTTVYSTTTGNGGTDSISFNATSARYVRMYGTQRATAYGYSLFELQVFAPPSGITATKTVQAAQSALAAKRPALALSAMTNANRAGALYNVKGERIGSSKIAQQAVVINAR